MRYDIMSYSPVRHACGSSTAGVADFSITRDLVLHQRYCVRLWLCQVQFFRSITQLLLTDRPFRVCAQSKGCRFIAWLCPVSVVVSLSKKVNSHCSSISNCIIEDLVSTGEVACTAVTSMGTWGSKYQPFMPHIQVKAKVGLHAHTFTCETWYSLLQSPGGYASTDS